MGRHHRRILNEAKRRYNEKQKEAKNIIEKSKVLDHLTSTMRITLILIILMIILTPILVYIRKHQTISKNIQSNTFTIPRISEPVSSSSMSNIPNSHFEAETVNYPHTQPPLSSAYKSILGSENIISNTESYPHQHEVQGLINGVKGAMKDLQSFRNVNEFY